MNKLLLIAVLLASWACTGLESLPSDQMEITQQTLTPWPQGFPDMVIPSDNPLNEAKVMLGRRLFFDSSLSLDSTVSCASCHIPSRAFSDTVAFSRGVQNRRASRNAPPLMNSAFNPHFMAEGGVKSLELQVLAPLENIDEMGMTVGAVCDRLNADNSYLTMFKAVWNSEATPFTLTRSIAAFERMLIGGNSKYDDFIQGDSSAFDSLELRGRALFYSDRFGCDNCHSGILFTNHAIENNGLYEQYADNGLFRLSLRSEDKGKFKVPSLRNIALTGPYMHDGSLKSLDDVLNHYSTGGELHPNKSPFIRAIDMTEAEKRSVIAFLLTLTEQYQPL